jgi:putative membrane-bound dehydrogenase-like protein
MLSRLAGILLGISAVATGRALQAQAPKAGGIEQAVDAPKALAAAESLKRFRLPDGFHIELVAAEPAVVEPTGICFDARGRIYACELHGYNLDGYYDVLELNKTGKLDTSVRRIPAGRAAVQKAARATFGTVKLLEDVDGDGHVDRTATFANRLPPCYGVVPARDGVIALCASDILYLADRDGDGTAEVRETLFTGFGVGELWTRISNPRWGVDNWIYAACGQSSSGVIRGPRLRGEVHLGNSGFRFRADGSALEPVTGGTSGFGLALDDWGDRFLCTNQQHALYVAPLPFGSLARNPYQVGVNPVINISGYGHPARVFPSSRPDPWRRKRGDAPAWVAFYGANETESGLLTSACGPLIYQAELFPEAYRGNHFCCEPAQNLVHRCRLEPAGAGFIARRADVGLEFLTSTDPWFRPVSLAVGPEGALYVVDMYREIIEDYSAIPRYLQQQYVESLRNGHDRGRIWRIAAGPGRPRAEPILAAATRAELVETLACPNAWRRLTAQRLLVERRDDTAVNALKAMLRSKSPHGRLHALYTLEGLTALGPAQIESALGDAHYGLRWHGLQLAERWLDKNPTLRARAIALAKDRHAKVRLQAAFSLGTCADAEALQALAGLARREGEDRWTQVAILSSVGEHCVDLAKLLANSGSTLLPALASVAGARNLPEEMADLLGLIAGLSDKAVQRDLLTGLAEGLEHSPTKKQLSGAGQRAFDAFLDGASGDVLPSALHIAALVQLRPSARLNALRASARERALDAGNGLNDRLGALGLLTGATAGELLPLGELLAPRHPQELQLATVRLLAAGDDGPAAAVLLLRQWEGYSPRLQTAVLEAVCGRQDRLPVLLAALEKRTVEPSSVPPLRRAQLLESSDPATRARAKAVWAAHLPRDDRRHVLQTYRRALYLPRDPVRGRQVFEKECQKCHALAGRGFALGPELGAVQNRPDEAIVSDILDPNSTITPGFPMYTVVTRQGSLFTGILAAETATSVTLRREQGAEDVILRTEIEQMRSSARSLMPDGLEQEIGIQDMADLLGYLREALRSGGEHIRPAEGR